MQNKITAIWIEHQVKSDYPARTRVVFWRENEISGAYIYWSNLALDDISKASVKRARRAFKVLKQNRKEVMPNDVHRCYHVHDSHNRFHRLD